MRTTDKFADTGLTSVRSDLVDAPYVEECSLVVECKPVEAFELGLGLNVLAGVIVFVMGIYLGPKLTAWLGIQVP